MEEIAQSLGSYRKLGHKSVMNSSSSSAFTDNQGEVWAHRQCSPGRLAGKPAVSSHCPTTTRFRHLPSKVKLISHIPGLSSTSLVTKCPWVSPFNYLFYCVTLVSLAFNLPYKSSPIWIIITSYSELLRQLWPTWRHSPSLTFYLLILLRTQHRCLIYLCFLSSCCSVA